MSNTRKRIKSDTNAPSNLPIYPFMGQHFNPNEMFNPFMSINPYFNYPFLNGFGVNYPYYYVPYQPMINL